MKLKIKEETWKEHKDVIKQYATEQPVGHQRNQRRNKETNIQRQMKTEI